MGEPPDKRWSLGSYLHWRPQLASVLMFRSPQLRTLEPFLAGISVLVIGISKSRSLAGDDFPDDASNRGAVGRLPLNPFWPCY